MFAPVIKPSNMMRADGATTVGVTEKDGKVIPIIKRVCADNDHGRLVMTALAGHAPTQVTASIIEFIFVKHSARGKRTDTGQRYRFSLWRLGKYLGEKWPDPEWLRKQIDIMFSTRFELFSRDTNLPYTFSIVAEHGYSRAEGTSHKFGPKMGSVQLAYSEYDIVFTGKFLELFENEIRMYYPRVAEMIPQLKSGAAQAMVRHVLSPARRKV
jgi:hypothetical protein